jgi:hypothetical protein
MREALRAFHVAAIACLPHTEYNSSVSLRCSHFAANRRRENVGIAHRTGLCG